MINKLGNLQTSFEVGDLSSSLLTISDIISAGLVENRVYPHVITALPHPQDEKTSFRALENAPPIAL